MAPVRLALILVVAVAALTGCDRYRDDIDAVKQAQSIVGGTNEAMATEIAGARGTVEWKGGPAPKYESADIVGVQAVIKRISANGNRHEVELDFINNRQTKKVAFDGAIVDGKKQDMLSGALAVFLMQLE
ncbi:hypothetical protein [Dongia sedimenti]|uniref:Lipoprotein n=1 Tax=Dongia sedimenti TaxID=3064282 RepID=A0ABU0YN77_9PROT|nr:hypothetical protein [Rhodospirillaceae bacterium R-7]